MKEIHIDDAIKVLKDTTRRRIIRLLAEEGPLEYSEILRRLGLKTTGKLNYHLKVLKDFIGKDEKGRYYLNNKGKLLYNIMINFRFNSENRRWFHALLMISIILLVFSSTLLFYTYSGYGYYGELIIVGRSLLITSFIMLLISILFIETPKAKITKLTIRNAFKLNYMPIAIFIVIIITESIGTRYIPTGALDLMLWCSFIIPPLLSWILTIRKYGLDVRNVLLSSIALSILSIPSILIGLIIYTIIYKEVFILLLQSLSILLLLITLVYISLELALTFIKKTIVIKSTTF